MVYRDVDTRLRKSPRRKLSSLLVASSLGAAITMLMCGFLIASLGWESVFYVTGVIGIIWSVTWFLLVFDSPSQHPRISPEERQFIENAIGTTTTTKVVAVQSVYFSFRVHFILF